MDALSPAGAQAARIEELWWVFFAVACAVYALVGVAFAIALMRGRRRDDPAGPHDAPALDAQEAGASSKASALHPVRVLDEKRERRVQHVITAASIVTLATLLGLLVASVRTGAALASLDVTNAIHVEVTGKQWWWSVRYRNDVDPTRDFVTANEIHVPVGVPVVLTLKSDDVIHSLWIPELAGKRDLVPGRELQLPIRADKPGVYRGQCAEFCGLAHARMGIVVVAHPPGEFARWRDHQLTLARPPASDVEKRGQEVFLTRPCATCHAIRGTSAGGATGPDLTHVASRTEIAAGTLANEPEAMRTWIRHSQRVKPGNNMPDIALPDDELDALVAYLESLR